MDKKTVRDVDVQGQRVLMRVDFNVPLEEGQVADDTRIEAALPTIRYLLEREVRLVLMSHLGRPKGEVVERLRMAPVGARLSELLDRPVRVLADCVGPEVEDAVEAMEPGDVALLENTRFHPEEKANDPQFAQKLARLGQLYVNDAFGAAHRAHASTEGVAHYLPGVAGLLMERELNTLAGVLESPEPPFVVILGGAKISDKIGVIRNLIGRTDAVLIGGGMANTFLLAQGYDVGQSLVEEDAADTAAALLEDAQELGIVMGVPVDVVVAGEFSAEADFRTVPPDEVPGDWRILDIGPKTVEAYRDILIDAATIFWNGPMGVFELKPFALGTRGIAEAVAGSGAFSVVGGGDSVAALQQMGLAGQIDHISTGGGASLQFLEGEPLPGVEALEDR